VATAIEVIEQWLMGGLGQKLQIDGTKVVSGLPPIASELMRRNRGNPRRRPVPIEPRQR
jgi:hypothetical protein